MSGCEKGYTTSSLGHSSLDRINDEEKEDASSQLVLNKRRSQVVPTLDLEGTSFAVLILRSDSKDDLVHALCLSVHGTKVVGTSSREAGVMRFKNLKKTTSVAILPTEAILPTIRAPHQPLGHWQRRLWL